MSWRHHILASICVLALSACGAERVALPALPAARSDLAEPEALPGWRATAIDLVLDARVRMGARSGYVALIARDGRLVHAAATGYSDVESGTPMDMQTRFRMASMTKPVTAVAAMILVEEGRLGLDDLVSDYLPAFGELSVAVPVGDQGTIEMTPLTTPMTIRHLLTFSSGIGGAADDDGALTRAWKQGGLYKMEGSLVERVAGLAQLPLYEQPGTRWRYGASLDVLAAIVEIVAREPLNQFMERRIFTPLGMHATRYPMDTPADAPLARMYTQDEEGELVPAPPSEFAATNWTPGGGGLNSTAPDYMRFALMLWNEGEYAGVRILRPETVREMTRLQVGSGVLADMGMEGLGFGLGMSVLADPELAILPGRKGDFWWGGAYGTQFWVSPSTGIVVVVLQQNQMGPHADSPFAPSVVQALALTD